MPRRDEIVAEARRWIDAPWRHQGRSMERGIDCCGLILKVAHNLNISDFDISGYNRNARGQNFRKYFEEHMVERYAMNEALDGDVYLFRDGKTTCHCGIIATMDGKPSIIHAYGRVEKVMEHALDEDWLSRRTGCFIYPGVE